MKIYIEYEASKAALSDKRLPLRGSPCDHERIIKFFELYAEHYNLIRKEALEKGDIFVSNGK